MTTNPHGAPVYTDAQLEAILDAQDENPGLTPEGAVALLQRQGHPDFPPSSQGDPLADLAPLVPAAPREAKHLPTAGVDRSPAEVAWDDELDAGDFRLSYLALAQDKTEADVPPGSFFLSALPEDHSETRKVLVLHFAKRRRLMSPYKDNRKANRLRGEILERRGVQIPEDRRLWCRANGWNGTPEPSAFGTVNDDCPSCPYSEWEGGSPPECRQVWDLLVLDLDTELPATLEIKGGGMKGLGTFLTLLGIQVKLSAKRGGMADSAGFVVELSSKKEGDNHIIVFGRPVRCEDEDAPALGIALRAEILGGAR